MVTSADDILEVLAPMRGRGGLSAAKAALEEATARSDGDFRPVAFDAEAAVEYVDPRDVVERRSTTLAAQVSARASDDAPIETVLAVLGPAPTTLDEIVRATGLGIRDVRIALLELSLAGRVEQHGGQLVSLKQTGGV
jgi:DNA processing protein